MRAIRTGTLLLCALMALAATGCASTVKKPRETLERVQTAWTSAIRWSDFETAQAAVDPDYLADHPLDALTLERYAQVQVTGYRALSAQVAAETASREVEIRLVSRHTMAERTVRVTEQWRWDATAGTWWNTTGLPDFWDGE